MTIFPKKRFLGPIISAVVLGATAFVLWIGTKTIQNDAGAQSLDALGDTLRRASVHCYAVEGRYPPNLEYLCSAYSISYDEERYRVYYTLSASNLVPDVTIIELGEGVVE